MIDLDRVIKGEFRTLDDVLAASVLVADGQVQVRKADSSVYGGVIEQARITAGRVFETFKRNGSNTDQPWFKVAADFFIAESRQAIATGSAKGYTEAQMKLFDRYTRELYDALSAGAPLLERNEEGNFELGGRSAINAWMKKHREELEQEQRKQSAELAKQMGMDPSIVVGEKPDTEAETTEGYDLSVIDDPEVRGAVADLVLALAELASIEEKDRTGTENGKEKALRLVGSWSKALRNITAEDWEGVIRAAHEEAAEDEGDGNDNGGHTGGGAPRTGTHG